MALIKGGEGAQSEHAGHDADDDEEQQARYLAVGLPLHVEIEELVVSGHFGLDDIVASRCVDIVGIVSAHMIAMERVAPVMAVFGCYPLPLIGFPYPDALWC